LPSDRDLDEYINLRIINERRAIQFLNDSMSKTGNPVIRLLLHQLALDSAKHEQMLNVILELLKDPSSSLSKAEDQNFQETMAQHIKIEQEMTESFEKLIEKISDKRIRFILEDIKNDDKTHHSITRHVYELISESQKRREEEWWEFLFRYSTLSK
jgi:rubrerythrin